MRLHLYAVSAITVTFVATLLPAQARSNYMLTSADCQRAADSLTAGSRTASEWSYIDRCGAAGTTALTTTLGQLATETDTLYLGSLLPLFRLVQDDAMLQQARVLAENRDATVAARVTAVAVLLGQHSASADLFGFRGWNQVLGTPDTLSCGFGSSGESGYSYVGPMPSNYREQIAETADTLAYKVGENAVVKSLGLCLRRVLRAHVPETVPPAAISVTYVCGTKFRITNASPKPAVLGYRLKGATETSSITVAPGGFGSLMTLRSGPLEVIQGNQVIGTTQNTSIPC